MNGKPVILYVESRYGSLNGPNHDREALAFFLANDLDCEVRVYDYMEQLKEDADHVSKLIKSGWVILTILCQERYMEDMVAKDIVAIRELSPGLPILILPCLSEARFKAAPETPDIFAYMHEDPELGKLVSTLVSAWTKPKDAFHVKTALERSVLCNQLANAYLVNNLGEGDEHMLGVPNGNDQIVLEAIRVGLVPAEFIKAEFDSTLPRRVQSFEPVEVSAYDKELASIKSMDEAARKEFHDNMLRARGMIPHEGGGAFCTGVGQGDNAWGFAIDWLTLQESITDRFGEHELAKFYLLQQLRRIEAMRAKTFDPSADVEYKCSARIVDGLILNNVDGLSVPVACMWTQGETQEHCQRVADHIIRSRRFIPVTPDGFILGAG